MTTAANKREMRERGVKKSKIIGGDKSKNLKQKYQAVGETLTRREDDNTADEEEETINEAEFQLPELVGVSLNLSKKNLKQFPNELLENMTIVQYLYLEGNKLVSLPQNFFQRLHSLKWLDLRNNCLVALPTDGLRDHPSLEVILLQGNRIRNLPAELAFIPSLKGLQTAENPIANVPYEVIAGGFQEVIKYLKKIFTQDEILLPMSETTFVKPSTSRAHPPDEVDGPTHAELRMWDLDKLSQWRQFMKKKSEIPKDQVSKSINDKPVLQQPKISVSLRSHAKQPLRLQPFRCGVSRNRHRHMASALHYFKMRKTRAGYKRRPLTVAMIQEKAMKEAHRAQVREALEKQAKKIQRMRDKEVLKNWQDHARITRHHMKLLDNYQEYPSKDFASKTPFDVDPEFLNMLNRVDLYRSLKDYDNKSKRIRKPRERITALDLERQMNEIIKKLQQLDTNDSGENTSPRTKQGHMCNKMYKIMDIQKTLKKLQTLNSSLNGILPIIKQKSKNYTNK